MPADGDREVAPQRSRPALGWLALAMVVGALGFGLGSFVNRPSTEPPADLPSHLPLALPAGVEIPYGYTGRRLDEETGLWYFHARNRPCPPRN